MSKVTTFADAFKACGIGGAFSKFRLVQVNEWFELVDVDTLADTVHCFRVIESFDAKPFDQISGREAQLLLEHNPEWLTYFKTAQKVVARVVKDHGTTLHENSYYLDRMHKSVYIVNGQFVIEVGPVLRIAPDIPSHAVYDFLYARIVRDHAYTERVKVFTRYGDVVVYYRDVPLYTNRTTQQFNEEHEVA